MAANVGSLVAYLDADTARFNASMKQAQREAQIMGIALNDAVSGKGGGMSSRAGGLAQQAGFMVQDFSAVLMGGGGIGRAIGAVTNNVQMLGMAFGPTGAAISAVGGALAGLLLPALLQTEDTTKRFLDDLNRQADATNRLVEQMQRRIRMEQEIKKLQEDGTERGVKEAKKQADNDLEQVRAEMKARGMAMETELNQALRENPNAWRQSKGPAQRFDDMGRVNKGVTIDFWDEKLGNKFEKDMIRLNELMAKERDLEAQRKKLDQVQPEARARDSTKDAADAFQREMKAFEEGMQRKQKLWDDTRGHLEKYNQRMEELKAMRIAGEIDDAQFMRGANKAALERPKVATQNQALEFGSAAAISAMIDNLAQNQERDEQLRLAKQALDEAKEQVRILKSVEKAVTDWRPVELAP